MSTNPVQMSFKTFEQPPLFKAWLIGLTASLLFFYEFIQINIMNSLNPFLASDLHLSAVTISSISSVYFIANVLLLPVAGMLLDMFRPKLLILAAMSFCTLGTFLFGTAHSLTLFVISRALIGFGGAFCFLGSFRIATRWFVPGKLSQITGTIVTMAMLGGLLGQQPAVYLIKLYGWRHTLFLDAALGVIFILLIALIVRDAPDKERLHLECAHVKLHSVIDSIKKVVSKGQIWVAALYGCLLNLVIYVIGALWGLRYLTNTYHLKVMTASHISAFMLLGAVVGSLAIGALADLLSYKKTLMFICALVALLSMLALMFLHLNVLSLIIVFFCLGFFTSSQVMAYPHAAKQIEPAFQAMATSMVSFCMLGSTAIMQPLFAALLVAGDDNKHPIIYHYDYGLAALAVCLGISVLLSFVIDIHNKKHYSSQ